MSELNPSDFIITRKRKKYRFAMFSNSKLCFESDEWDRAWRPDVVEVGAGSALFSVELARRHQDKNFVAVDVKADRLQKGAYLAEAARLQNIRFVRCRADLLADLFEPSSVQQIWLTFPDPFPRERSAKHRLTNSNFLSLYRTLLKDDGHLLLKHDNLDFFNYSLEQIVEAGWRIGQLSFDLHQSSLSEDYKILTTYEERWLSEGLKTYFISASPA